MKRRSFITGGLQEDDITSGIRPTAAVRQNISSYANKILPRLARTTSGLEPYSGPWGIDQISHLLRRALFGVDKNTIQTMLAGSLPQLVTQLLSPQAQPNPPVNTNSLDIDVPIGQSWVIAAKNDTNGYNPNSSRIQSLKSWWIGLMLGQPVSLIEKMTLFWHNHLVTETNIVGDARFCYQYNDLLRQYALGNVKELLYQATVNPGMLVYLNGNTNSAGHPNENYARELQELFTIGKGPEIAPGNYTYYTEADVQAAARVLTGWQTDSSLIISTFTTGRHDVTNKQFSSAYQNQVILGKPSATRPNEIDGLLSMIFGQTETARYFCRKLYRWFVYYLIDDTVEANVIAPMATILQSNNYEIRPVLQALFSSAHFYDPLNIGCMIKNPIDHVVGTSRLFDVAFPDSSNVVNQYAMWNYLRTQGLNMQQDIGDPPNVAGWPEYYQDPQFYELWINSDTLPKRDQFTDTLIGKGHTQNGFTLLIDPIAFVNKVSNPADPNTIVAEFAQMLFPIAITDNQKAFLKETLIPGLPDYEWTTEWNSYLADPTNQTKLNAVKSKLQALLKYMMDMPEYQLM